LRRRLPAESTESCLDCVAKLIDIRARRRARTRVYKGIFELKAKRQPSNAFASGGLCVRGSVRFAFVSRIYHLSSRTRIKEKRNALGKARNEQERLLREKETRRERISLARARARARGRDSQIKIRAVVSSRRLEMRVGADNVGNCPNVIVIDARSARASARRQRKLN